MRRIGLFLVVAMLPACSTRAGGSDVTPNDAGGHPMDASGGSDGGGTDAGHLADGAPIDGGTPVDGGPIGDGGPIDSGISCMDPVPALPAAAFPRCSAATHACIDGCIVDAGTGTAMSCVAACEHDDLTPSYAVDGMNLNCGSCLNYEQRRCIDMFGCHTQVAAFDCCLQAHCPDGSCIGTSCATEYSAFSMCAMMTAVVCVSSPTAGGVGQCFADADGGA